MNSLTEFLLRDLWRSLRSDLASLASLDELEQAFAVWALGNTETHAINPDALLRKVHSGAHVSRSYRDVGILGYLAHTPVMENRVDPALSEGLQWLSGRPAFGLLRTPTFEVDGLGLLGIALGIRRITGPLRDKASEWMLGFVPDSLSQARVSSWNKILISAAGVLLGRMPTELIITNDTADIRVALHALGVDLGITDPVEDSLAFLKTASALTPAADEEVPVLRSVIRLTALSQISQNMAQVDLKDLDDNDVLEVLQALPRAFKRWTWEASCRTGSKTGKPVKWDIENEYHVQNLLWFALAPLFPDLQDEENLPSIGPKHPRYDIGIPSLRLIIEVKFMRSRTQPELAKLVEQIAADANLYLSANSGYDKIIAFVWDNVRATEYHAELAQGLQKLDGVIGAVIHARPGTMS